MIALIWCTCTLVPAIADEEGGKEVAQYRIRIAFIFNFLKFVDWPGAVTPKASNAATVCIAGDQDFSRYFTSFEQAHKQSFAVTITDVTPKSALTSCHVLFIGKDAEDSAQSYLAVVKKQPVLSISEAKSFADDGGIIEMVTVGKSIGLFSKDKINLRINLKAAESSGLSIDARLLQIAADVIK